MYVKVPGCEVLRNVVRASRSRLIRMDRRLLPMDRPLTGAEHAELLRRWNAIKAAGVR
jgi:hypothetical protein